MSDNFKGLISIGFWVGVILFALWGIPKILVMIDFPILEVIIGTFAGIGVLVYVFFGGWFAWIAGRWIYRKFIQKFIRSEKTDGENND